MLLDGNLLLYAVNSSAPQHDSARSWLTDRLNGPRRVALPWQSIAAFLRLGTHPRVFPAPLTPAAAWERVADWLAAPPTWVPVPGRDHARIVGALITEHGSTGNLVPDAMLAALAIEHGLTLCSTDTDFARFPELRWENPLA